MISRKVSFIGEFSCFDSVFRYKRFLFSVFYFV